MRTIRHQVRGFTLVEIMIIIVILGILAALVVPHFADAGEEAADAAVKGQLQRIRTQIEVYRSQNAGDPDLVGNQWADLVDNDFLQAAPVNPLNESTVVDGAAGLNVGWVWRDKGNGTMALFATDETFVAEYIE